MFVKVTPTKEEEGTVQNDAGIKLRFLRVTISVVALVALTLVIGLASFRVSAKPSANSDNEGDIDARITRKHRRLTGLNAEKNVEVSNVLPGLGVLRGERVMGFDPSTRTNTPILRFLGIPYADPPIGDLRWRKPKPSSRWSGILDATSFKPNCIQFFTPFASDPQSEDCLYLNIWVPDSKIARHKRKTKSLPVLVFYHGGSFVRSGPQESVHEATNRTARSQDHIIITVAYRLGPFGLLANPDILETEGTSGGLMSVLDMIESLKWVRKYIQDFGGDANEVTISGHSSGGILSCVLIASPEAKGLFKRAFLESGPCTGVISTTEQAFGAGNILLSLLNSASVAEARSLPVSTIVQATFSTPIAFWQPSIDGFLITKQVEEIFRSGEVNGEDFLISGNFIDALQTGATFQPGFVPQTRPEFSAILRDGYQLSSEKIAMIEELYLALPLTIPRTFNKLTGDACFLCDSLETANLLSQIPNKKVWVHRYDGSVVPTDSFHASDLPFVFSNPNTSLSFGITNFDPKIAEVFESLLRSFVSGKSKHLKCWRRPCDARYGRFLQIGASGIGFQPQTKFAEECPAIVGLSPIERITLCFAQATLPTSTSTPTSI